MQTILTSLSVLSPAGTWHQHLHPIHTAGARTRCVVLYVVCCMLYDVCMLYVVCCMLYETCFSVYSSLHICVFMCSQRLIRTEEAQILPNYLCWACAYLSYFCWLHSFPIHTWWGQFYCQSLKNSISHAVFTYAAAIPTTSHQLPSNTQWRNIKSLLSWTSSIVELNLTTQDKLITLKFWDLNCKETILFLLILILHKYF